MQWSWTSAISNTAQFALIRPIAPFGGDLRASGSDAETCVSEFSGAGGCYVSWCLGLNVEGQGPTRSIPWLESVVPREKNVQLDSVPGGLSATRCPMAADHEWQPDEEPTRSIPAQK
ncbi:hypothetical protein H4Q26_006692 [Puccinia striiformis f. sp. tritici PST-130]|nr:hypothetical protein H4Q26_006692 [Puccinia striiformis f. sp. tritici PST-130]